MIKIIRNAEDILDFVRELSQTDQYASYPRRTSIKDIKFVIERALSSDNRNILACYEENVLYGVCIYNWLCDDNYAQTDVFLIREDYERVADEFIGFIREQLPGFELFIGLPLHNKNGNEYFKKKNIECISSSVDTRLYNLEPPMNQKHDKVVGIAESDFEEYAIFHDKFAIPLEMYYDSKNILKEIERFRVFAFREGEEIRGSILVKILKDCEFEVFGLFIDKEYEDKNINAILISEMFLQLYKEFNE